MLDSRADAGVGPTATDIARLGRINVGHSGIRIASQQRSGAHDLARLAVPTLRHIMLVPSHLHGMRSIFGQPLNGCNRLPGNHRYRHLTRANGLPIEMNSACATEPHPTAKLRAR